MRGIISVTINDQSLFIILFTLFALFWQIQLQAQVSQARGTVYLDTNDNNQRDNGEPGIADVKVSNGLDVVETDNNGDYAIELPDERILFISKPEGFRVPLNEVQLPQFYYLHYPEGTPPVADWQWPVIAPTGPLPDRIDFALLPDTILHHYKAMGFADPQARDHAELDMMRKDIIDELFGNPYEARFGLVAGDVVYDNLSLYERHNRLMAQIGIPIWNVPGNHDLNQESPDYTYATQTFKSVFGPDYYSFDYGQVHFLALNNIGYRGKGKGYEGSIDVRQMQWIANDLRDVPEDKLIVIITHIPLITYADRSFPGSINTVNLKELLDILSRFQYVYSISGHDTSNSWKVEVNHTHGWYGRPFIAHTLAEVRGNGWKGPVDDRGVRSATMADGNPNGYYLFHFSGHEVRPQFIPAGGDPTDRLRISLDPPLSFPAKLTDAAQTGLDRGFASVGQQIVVNFFDGGERDEVTISLNGQAPVTMVYSERLDPVYEQQYKIYEDSEHALPPPSVSSHIWHYDLPALEPGIHSALVKARDEFGFTDEALFTFEILADQ